MVGHFFEGLSLFALPGDFFDSGGGFGGGEFAVGDHLEEALFFFFGVLEGLVAGDEFVETGTYGGVAHAGAVFKFFDAESGEHVVFEKLLVLGLEHTQQRLLEAALDLDIAGGAAHGGGAHGESAIGAMCIYLLAHANNIRIFLINVKYILDSAGLF